MGNRSRGLGFDVTLAPCVAGYGVGFEEFGLVDFPVSRVRSLRTRTIATKEGGGGIRGPQFWLEITYLRTSGVWYVCGRNISLRKKIISQLFR